MQWIWDSAFGKWTSEAGGMFWICGKPASGKSTVMEYLTRDKKLQARLRRGINDKWTVVRHFFFDFDVSKDKRNNFEGFLRSLLYQLTKEFKAADLQGIEPDNGWSLRTLEERLTTTIKQRSNPICILLDGLDEYQGDKWGLASFLRETASSGVKLCVASRPHQVFNSTFEQVPTIKMQEWNFRAIDKMVTLRIQRDMATSGFYKHKEVVELANEISAKAQGVFLWARFAIEELRDGWSEGLDLKELQKRLENVPEELEGIYARILRNLRPEQRQQAAYMLQLVCYAKRTLTLPELYAAIAHAANGTWLPDSQISAHDIHDFEKRILAVTGGVLEVFRAHGPDESEDDNYHSDDDYPSEDDSYPREDDHYSNEGSNDSSEDNNNSSEDNNYPSDDNNYPSDDDDYFSKDGDYPSEEDDCSEMHEDEMFVDVIHRTVRTYLENENSNSSGWFQILGTAHEGSLHAQVLWLRVCAAIFPPSFKELPPVDPPSLPSSDAQLSPTIFSKKDKYSDTTGEFSPLLEYAALFMLHHASDVEQSLGLSSFTTLQPGISNSFLRFHRFYWAKSGDLCSCFEDCPVPSHPVHLAIAHELEIYVEHFLPVIYKNNGPGSREWDDILYLEKGYDRGRTRKPPDFFRMSLLEFAIHASKIPDNSVSQTRIISLLLEQCSHAHDAEMSVALQFSSAEIVRLLLRDWPDGKMRLKSSPWISDLLERDLRFNGPNRDPLFEGLSVLRPDVSDFGPMWYIARRIHTHFQDDDAELIDMFVQRGEDINAQCSPIGTALHSALLHLAFYRWNSGMAELLVAKGANVNVSGPLGTPLEFV